MTRAVGIDLGTTHSVVAHINNVQHTEVLCDREGNVLLPSVVMFDDAHTFVGEEGKLRGRQTPERLAACVKREMGRPFYSQAIGGVRLPPEVIQACILRKLKLQIDESLGADTGVVITVPANFNDAQRRATTAAGEMAGLNVLGILNEPVAAVLAFSEQLGYPAGVPMSERLSFLVYDLGGYTFEITLLDVQPGCFTTLATDHDPHLGGHSWDMRLVDCFAEQMIRRCGVDPREDPTSLEDLLQRAAKAKLALGVRDNTVVAVTHDGNSIPIPISREEFRNDTADLLGQTMEKTEALLARAGLTWKDVPRVVLAGGATRMPEIRQMFLKRTGFEPLCFLSPDECVARGAAIFASSLIAAKETPESRPTFKVKNVSTHSLGIQGVDPKGRKINKILIPRGTPLPAAITKDFVTKTSAQKSITIVVLEGEDSDPAKCTTVGRAILRDLPDDLARDWPVQVIYAYSSDGTLTVDARVRYTEHAVHMEVERSRQMTDAQQQRWSKAVESEGGLTAMKQVVVEEQREQMSRPIPVGDTQEVAPEPQSTGVLSFLKRYMPFAFKPTESEPPSASDNSSAAQATTDNKPATPGSETS